ncbi:hypothetical protein ACOMHN_012450 [Nucella lapillus]
MASFTNYCLLALCVMTMVDTSLQQQQTGTHQQLSTTQTKSSTVQKHHHDNKTFTTDVHTTSHPSETTHDDAALQHIDSDEITSCLLRNGNITVYTQLADRVKLSYSQPNRLLSAYLANTGNNNVTTRMCRVHVTTKERRTLTTYITEETCSTQNYVILWKHTPECKIKTTRFKICQRYFSFGIQPCYGEGVYIYFIVNNVSEPFSAQLLVVAPRDPKGMYGRQLLRFIQNVKYFYLARQGALITVPASSTLVMLSFSYFSLAHQSYLIILEKQTEKEFQSCCRCLCSLHGFANKPCGARRAGEDRGRLNSATWGSASGPAGSSLSAPPRLVDDASYNTKL